MKDPKQILSRVVHWTNRRKSRITSSSTDLNVNDAEKSTSKTNTIIDNLELTLDLTAQALQIAEAAPFIGPAVKLLSSLITSYKEVKSTNEKLDMLATHISELTGDLCATILQMEAIKYSDIVGRLESDPRYICRVELIEKASKFVKKYDEKNGLVRVSARNQLGNEIDKLNQELNTFGARFRNNRLVDLTITQAVNREIQIQTHNMALEAKLEKWLLDPPEMKQKHHDTERLRADGTGAWLLAGDRFIEWQDNAGFLWLEGPSGAGKSVLSSAIIQQLLAENQTLLDGGVTAVPALAYFYFDFRHEDRRSAEIALRRIVLQLSTQTPHPHQTLNTAHASLSHGQAIPRLKELYGILEEMLSGLTRTYIILDGLDECDDLEQVVNVVSRLRNWTKSPLHLFIASQPRSIFRERFGGAEPVHFDAAEGDVYRFVTHELESRDKLKIWRNHKGRIADEVTLRSKGMFRLAAMLLVELSKCRLVQKLDETFRNLPGDLFAVYDRFFERISKGERPYVDAVLQWIMFSSTEYPLGSRTLAQLSDAIAFDFDSTVEYYAYMPEARESNRVAIFEWLEGLIVESKARINGEPVVFIVLSHASVQYYLHSPHFAKKFGQGGEPFKDSSSHAFIARACITMKLLEDGSPQYSMLGHLHRYYLDSPLHFCVQEGYIEGVRALTASNTDSINLVGEDSRATPLVIAARDGHTDIAHMLLENGANIHLHSSYWGSALRIAACNDHIETLQLLLEHGAAEHLEQWGDALSGASDFGCRESVQLLLGCGVDITEAEPYYRTALKIAFKMIHSTILDMLLEAYPEGKKFLQELELKGEN
ncbi:hypothetical protein B0H14DRAFT_2968386 [Mycena olivaceomarginata]|nr:hypothetical protein B0H14DRAFT_2968386 [Mycena olivaceomarginata]